MPGNTDIADRKSKRPINENGKVHGDVLAEKVGITTRQLRDIAKQGYFSPPDKGYFVKEEAERGLFKYYRELSQRRADTKKAIDEEKHRKLKLENDEFEGTLVEKLKVIEELSAWLIPIRELLRQKFENELPMSMSGMGVAESRMLGKRHFDQLSEEIEKIFKKWKI